MEFALNSHTQIQKKCALKDVSNTVCNFCQLIKYVYCYSICYVGLFSLRLLLKVYGNWILSGTVCMLKWFR